MDIKDEIIIEILESYIEFIDMVLTDDELIYKKMASFKKEKWGEFLKDFKGCRNETMQ